MKSLPKITIIIAILFLANKSFAQIGISATAGYTPATNAMLDINSTTKGLLIPRMTTAQRNTLLATATDGLTVYDITTKSFWYYNGIAWTALSTGNNWINAGNDILNGNLGNVGIGNGFSIPLGKLQIESIGSLSALSSNTDPFLRMRITNNFNYGWLRFENSDASKHFSQRFDLFSTAQANSYSMFYGTDQLFTIRGDGKFGLNVTAPADLLHLSPISATGDVYTRISSTSGLTGLRLQNNLGDWSIYSNEFSKLFIGYSADNFATNNQVIIAEPSGIDYNFIPSNTNQVFLGTSTNRWKEVNTVNLGISGNTLIAGELNRTANGDRNMIPIAYGTLNGAGTFYSTANSGNVSCTKTAIGTYEITILSETYTHFSFITTVTPNNSFMFVTPKMVMTSSNAGKLYVFIYNSAGVLEDTPFSFVTYKQ